jgi:hypothetical protein
MLILIIYVCFVVNVVSVVINVSIIIKIKCLNFGSINDKLNFIRFTTTNTHFFFIKIHTNITIFDTFSGTVLPRDLSISDIHINIYRHKWFFLLVIFDFVGSGGVV